MAITKVIFDNFTMAGNLHIRHNLQISCMLVVIFCLSWLDYQNDQLKMAKTKRVLQPSLAFQFLNIALHCSNEQ